jgi:hypothetical protein
MQGIGNGSGFFLSDGLSFIRWQIFGFPLDLVQLANVFEGSGGQLAFVGLVQVVELAPSVRLMWSST